MNQRPRLPLLLLALVLLGGVGALIHFSLRGPAAGSDPGEGLRADSRPASLTVNQEAAPTPEAPRLGGARSAVDANASLASDPEYTAALAGFTGRLVTHERTPAADRKVRLIDVDVRTLLGTKAAESSEEIVEPELDAGEATTGPDGRFTIHGTWPRGFYLLIAAAEADDQTLVILERSPGPGEVIDLGDIELDWAATITGSVVDPAGKAVAGAYVRAVDVPGVAAGAVRLEYFVPGCAVIVGEGEDKVVFEMPAWLEKRIAQLPMATTRSDAEGRFRLGGVRAGSNLFTIAAPGLLGFVNPALRLKPGQTKDVGTVTLAEGELVQGKVIDTKGKPVAGAEVLVAPKSLAAPLHLARSVAPTDAEGRFSTAGVPTGSVLVAARRDPGSAWTITDPQPTASEHVVKLPATHTLTLRLSSKAGLPLGKPKLTLTYGPLGQEGVGMVLFGVARKLALADRTHTREDGALEISGLIPGEYHFAITMPGHALHESSLKVVKDVEHTIELDAENSLVVRICDTKNRPLPNVTLHVNAQPRRSDFPFYAGKSSADGTVVVKFAASATKLSLLAQHPRYGVASQEFALPVADPRVVLVAPGELVGIASEAGRPPQPGKWTIVVAPEGGGRNDATMPRLATPGLDGRFGLRGLVPGTYRAFAMPTLRSLRSLGSAVNFGLTSAFGMEEIGSQTATFEVRSGESTEIHLELDRKPLDPDQPAANVQGTVFVDDKPAVGMLVMAFAGRSLKTTVDERGHFDLGHVPVGSHHLLVVDPDADHGPLSGLSLHQVARRAFTVKENVDQSLEIVVRTGSLRGRVVRADGAPAGGAFVVLESASTEGRVGGSELPASCDDRGRFEIQRVPEGVYTVRGQHFELGIGEFSGLEVRAGVPSAEIEVRLQPTVEVKGTLDRKRIGAEENSAVMVQLVHAGSGSKDSEYAQVDREGRFTIERVLPGTYRLEIDCWTNDVSQEFEHAGAIVVGEKGVSGLEVVPGPKKGPEEKK